MARKKSPPKTNIEIPEEKDLLRFVLDFADGTLFTIAKQRNGEIERPGCALQETV